MLKQKPVRIAMWLVSGLALVVALGWLGYALLLNKPSAPSGEAAISPAPLVSSSSPLSSRSPSSPASSYPGVTFAPTTPVPGGTTSRRPNLIKPVPSAVPIGFGVVTSRSLNLRVEPSTEAAIIGGLKFGDIVTVIRRDGGWYQTSEGGWLSALYLEVRQTKIEAESYARELIG